MIDFNVVENLPPYDFADEKEWDEARLRSTAGKLFRFLREHVATETAPEEILFDADQALGHLAFELKMRQNEAESNALVE